MGLSTAGVGSGLDVEGIVASLMNSEKRPLNLVTQQKIELGSKLTAFGTIRSSISSFQTAVNNLASNSKFGAQLAKVGDDTVAKATANGSAQLGTYTLAVKTLAAQDKISSKGFASNLDTVGTGTLKISLGTYDVLNGNFSQNAKKEPVTITIDSTNNTLAGVRDAINKADAGVTATIINDGSTSGRRLVITSKETGESNAIKIDVTDTDGINTDMNGLSAFSANRLGVMGSGYNMEDIQVANNAEFTLDGIDISSEKNTVSDAIEGVTFNLLKTSPMDVDTGDYKETSLTISRDDNAAKFAMADFVKVFNELNVTVKTLSKFDQANQGKNNGPLIGDSTARTLIAEVKQMIAESVGSGAITTLNQVGITFQKDGSLLLDSTKMNKAFEENIDALTRLFKPSSVNTDPSISFSASSNKTKTGVFGVDITQLATKTELLGSTPPNLTITQGVNDIVNLRVDGVKYTLTLNAGTYADSNALLAMFQEKLSLAKAPVSASLSGGAVKLTLSNFGNDTLTVDGGQGDVDLFGTPVTTLGLDVAGTINGEAAVGNGQKLKSTTGNAEGLELLVQGLTTGNRGTASFNTGFSAKLSSLLDKYISSTEGLIQAKTKGIDSSIDRLTKQQEALNLRLAAVEKRYRAQFSMLDTKISQLSTTSTFLTAQLAQFSANASVSK